MTSFRLSSNARSAVLQAIDEHKLPAAFDDAVQAFYLPVARHIAQSLVADKVTIIGIQGSQGSG